ncbi:MAG: hypothetical protein ACI4MV_01260 [Christensenellales bacterium]
MKTTFRYKPNAWIAVSSTVLSIILLVCAIVNVLRLCGVRNMQSYNYPLDIIATVICVVMPVLLLVMIYGSAYTLTERGIRCNIGVFFHTISYQDVLLIRQDSDKTVLILYIKTTKQGQVVDSRSGIQANILQVNVDKKHFDAVIDAIKAHNPHTIYEILPMAHKEKK